MNRNMIAQLFVALAMISPSIALSQLPNDEKNVVSTPAPLSLKFCLARMINDNKRLELLVVNEQSNREEFHYEVSLPVIVNGKKGGYRTEWREATRKVTKYQYSYCELDALQLDAYQTDGKRITVEEVSEKLKPRELTQYTPVILSESPPDDLIAGILAEDRIVFVVANGVLKFKVRDVGTN